MSIFKKLWNGEIFIAENCVPKTEEYREAAHSLSEASESLESALDENQQKILEEYQSARADAETLIQIEVFRQGVQFGFELAKELTEEKIDKGDRFLEINNE